MKQKLLSQETDGQIAAARYFKCVTCNTNRACVVKQNDKLVCVNCRYNDIGKDALYEALYNGLD